MKKALALSLLLGTLRIASAGTTNVYLEDWGTTNGGGAVLVNGSLPLVGWTGVAVSQTTGPYLGIYAATGATDAGSGAPLTVNTVYFSVFGATQTTPGMFYTTDTAGAGSGGDSSFSDINPANYTNLALSVELRYDGGGFGTNYFAVRVGPTQWYVSTTQFPNFTGGYPTFTNFSLPYTNLASAWNLLTVGTTNVTIGGTPGANLSGNITGIGIVETSAPGGGNYNQVAVTAFAPGGTTNIPPTINPAPISQTVYAGGGATFLAGVSGTQPLTIIWATNGVQLVDGGRISGSSTPMITITNLQASDDSGAGVTYSLTVTNIQPPAATSPAFTLTVSNVPPDFLYAETFPYIGPNGNLPITGVGWVGAFQGATGIYTSGGGVGNVFSYSGVATTNIYYTTTTNDTGASGLPFVAINPDAEPNVTFEANFTPGNGAGLDSSNVVAYWAVQMQNGSWYSSANRIPVQTISTGNFQQYQMAFARTAALWNTVTIGANSASIGGHPGAPLAGNITGAGVVITHLGLNGGGDFNFNSFVLTTNPVTIQPVSIGLGTPFSQAAPSGGGVSFGVSATGQQPISYGWTLKGVTLVNSGRISGADTATLTIGNLTSNDVGQIIAYVTNSAGTDNSLTEPAGGGFGTDTELTVTNAPIGQLYSETFPFVGPLAGNYPISSAGWVEAVSGVPNALFENGLTSDGSVFAFRGSADTTAYYTTSASDTNQAGVAFPSINLAFYPSSSLNISVDIAPTFNAINVTAYLAVQVGTNWYVAANALTVPTTDSPTYATYSTAFNPAAANWKNLSISGTGALIGSAAASDLKGTMTGAGLVFVTVGAGGNHNFDNFIITGPGIGGITSGPLTGGNLNLSWIANPVVGLQSSTSLNPQGWTDVAGTLGKSSYSAPAAGPQMYFRLASH